MAIDLFRLDPTSKKLFRISSFPMDSLGLSESNDLEDWLATCKDRLFGRDILWIARQDRPSHEQRSDIIGVAQNGDLLITELKRGLVEENAVTQALGYTAEYHEKSAEDLENLFFEQSSKTKPVGLIAKAVSLDDAKKKLAEHLGPDVGINETQIVVILGEQFSAKALAICNYLNIVLDPELCSFECWRYSVHKDATDHFLSVEQLLPPPNARALIEERREDSKSRKYARDPIRIALMRAVVSVLNNTAFKPERNRGQVYECRIVNPSWPKDVDVWFSVKEKHPAVWVPLGTEFAQPPGRELTPESRPEENSLVLMFNELDSDSAKFTETFQGRLTGVLGSLQFPSISNNVDTQSSTA